MSVFIAPKGSARISPDRPSVGVVAIFLVACVMLTSMVFSFTALRDAARWTGAAEWALFLAPVYIDGSILAYTVALAIFRWRGEFHEARSSLRWLRSFTAFSSLVNGMHAASDWGWDFGRYEAWGGVAIAMLAPVAALISAEQIIRLVFRKEPDATAQGEAASDVVASSDSVAPATAPVVALAEEPAAEPMEPMLPVDERGLYQAPIW